MNQPHPVRSGKSREPPTGAYDAAWEELPFPALIVDEQDIVQRANAAAHVAAGWLGHTRLVGHPVWDLLPPPQRPPLRELLARARSTGRAEEGPHPLGSNGELTHYCAFGLRLPDGRTMLLAQDVSALHDALERAATSEQRLRGIVESSSDLIMLTQPDGVITYLSPSCRDLLGWEPQELLGRPLTVAHADDRPLVQAAHDRALRGLGGSGMEYRIVTKQGHTHWVSHSWAPVRVGAEVLYVVSIIRDVTERAAMVAALRDSHERYQRTIDALEDPIYVASDQYEIEFMNAAMRAQFGDRVGEKCYAVFHGRSAPCEDYCDLEPALHGQSARREWTSPAGRVYDTLAAPLVQADGRRGKVTVFRDITERRRMERSLGESQKLAAVGQLAAGVAHEFNNILATINGYAQLALSMQDPAATQKALQMAVTGCARASDITRSLLSFARPGDLEADELDIVTCLEAALSLVEPELQQAGIEVRRACENHLPTVRADAGQLQQVFLNLFLNALDAMPEGGLLTISADSPDPCLDAAMLAQGDSAEPQHWVRVEVRDTGRGIAAEHLSRIFEPFFTTGNRRGPGQAGGTGLGLSVVHGIIRAHNGTIRAESTEGQGAAFVIELPAGCQASVSAPLTPRPAAAPRDPSRRVLVVEDDSLIRELLRDVLTVEGYDVVTATDGQVALQHLQDEQFDLVLTDLLMPRVNGDQVLEAVLQSERPCPVVILTGRADDEQQERLEQRAHAVLAKPFQIADLLQVLGSAVPSQTAA